MYTLLLDGGQIKGWAQRTAGSSLCAIIKQGNSIARDLPRTGSDTNTTIVVIPVYILDIDSHCPYLLSGETTFQLTSCSNSLHVYLRFGETTSPI